MGVSKTNNSTFNTTNINGQELSISAINAFSDNYIWVLQNNTQAAIVDPGDAEVCINYLESENIKLNAILITHHHADHTGGIKKLIAYCQEKHWPLTVYGPATEVIAGCDIKLVENDQVDLPDLGITFRVIDLPGHTLGHIAYFAGFDSFDESKVTPILFCGDTLFSGGCGRIFEGTPEQMLNSLTKLAILPEHTKVYCAHEYTQANLKFALTVDPTNQNLINYDWEVKKLRESNERTIPTSIKIEKLINPFLRCHESDIQSNAIKFDSNTQANSLDTFTSIRRWKDQF